MRAEPVRAFFPVLCAALLAAAAAPAGAQLRFSAPVYQVGTFDAPAEQVFGRNVTPALAPSGDMYLGDWSTGQVRHFGRDGRFLGSFGRKGQGPGEFMAITSMALDRTGDSLYVFDEVNKRVSVLTTRGRLARTFSPPLTPVSRMRMTLHPDGFVLFTGEAHGSQALVHVTTTRGRYVRSFGRVLEPGDLSGIRSMHQVVRGQLNQGYARALPGGDVLVVLEAPYRVARFGLDGRQRWSVTDAAVRSPAGSMVVNPQQYRPGFYPRITAAHVLGPDRFLVLYADFEQQQRSYDVRSASDGRLLARRRLPFRNHVSALLPTGTQGGLAIVSDLDPFNRFVLSRWELN
jgi:hypothetical protein